MEGDQFPILIVECKMYRRTAAGRQGWPKSTVIERGGEKIA